MATTNLDLHFDGGGASRVNLTAGSQWATFDPQVVAVFIRKLDLAKHLHFDLDTTNASIHRDLYVESAPRFLKHLQCAKPLLP